MLDKFKQYITHKQLFTKQHRLLLTVSGGIDSVVLAELCHRAEFRFGIAHCNFGLRGQESDGDEAFVRTLAQRLGVEVFVQHFDTKSYAHTHGVSTQMAARDLRYAWFEELRMAQGFDYVLTAHHQHDQLETVLLNLTRGTGLAGLRGMLYQNGAIVRPMLGISRTEIEQFAQQNALVWREDSSNQSDHYRRNLLRHQVVPVLAQINPNITAAVAQMAAVVRLAEQLVEAQCTDQLPQISVFERYGVPVRGSVINIGSVSQALLSFKLAALSLNHDQIQVIWEARQSTEAKTFITPTHEFGLSRGELVMLPRQKPVEQAIEINEDYATVFQLPFGDVCMSNDPAKVDGSWEVCFDASKLEFPLKMRPWEHGDRFCPHGLGGKSKKISDFLTDKKIPAILKPQVWVLETNQKIAWLLGFRTDERFGVITQTDKILKINIDINI